MEFKAKDLALYLITDRRWLKEGEKLEDIVEETIENGVSFIQLREKDIEYEEFKELGIKIKEVADRHEIPFVINDNVELAAEIDADGIHIGQDDMNIDEAREILGENKIIGLSAGNLQQAKEAKEKGADYIGVGAMFNTDTKSIGDTLSVEDLKEISEKVDIPIVAIGGINIDNIDELKDTGISGVSLISAILASDDIKASTKELYEKSKELFYEGGNI